MNKRNYSVNEAEKQELVRISQSVRKEIICAMSKAGIFQRKRKLTSYTLLFEALYRYLVDGLSFYQLAGYIDCRYHGPLLRYFFLSVSYSSLIPLPPGALAFIPLRFYLFFGLKCSPMGFHPLRISKRAVRGALALPHLSPQAAGPCSWACRRLLPLPPLSERNEASPPPTRGAGLRVLHAEGAGRRHCRPCPRTVYKPYAFPAKFNTILKQKINV